MTHHIHRVSRENATHQTLALFLRSNLIDKSRVTYEVRGDYDRAKGFLPEEQRGFHPPCSITGYDDCDAHIVGSGAKMEEYRY